MRLQEIIRSKRENWKLNAKRFLIRTKNKYLVDEQLQPGHTYRDQLTGELVTVRSISSQIMFDRHDADAKKQASASKDDARIALDLGLLVHDKHRCNRCPNQRRLNDV